MHIEPPSDSLLVRRGFRRPGKLRVAMRRAQGVCSRDIARECRLNPQDVESWLAEDEIGELVDCCRAMMDLPVEERLARLEREALALLEIAMEERDVRVALFLADQFSRGKNPARVLAEAVNRKVEQSTKPLDQPISKPRAKPKAPAARQPALPGHMMRPWAGMVSGARRQLSEELVRAFPSESETPASPASGVKPPVGPAIFQTLRNTPFTFPDLVPVPSTAPIALLARRPRDGPNNSGS